MRVDFAFVCDYAELSAKINALGIGFDTIIASQVPCKHPHFCLVIQLRANVVEVGEKDLEARLIDEDGRDVMPVVKGKFAIPPLVTGTESIGRIAMEFNNIEFPQYGSYSLHAVIEGQEMVRVPLKVSPPPSVN
ncbi:MAG: hypothetical protein PHU08_04805 [Dehalococcoidales bacterium]|jgi:hypothetical protein|nr:hypothetical protein [Dehalococcoidales bacterium]